MLALAVFSIGEIMKCHGKTCIISDINNKVGFNQYGCTNIDMGRSFESFGFEPKKLQ